jgi:hypothetical protein
MEMDVFLPDMPEGPVVVDAKYKTQVSSGNLQQMVAYCHITGARRAALVFPHGHLQDTKSFFFDGVDAERIRIDLAELKTDAVDVLGWRSAARAMVESAVSLFGVPKSNAA